jgi:hypothetical protein
MGFDAQGGSLVRRWHKRRLVTSIRHLGIGKVIVDIKCNTDIANAAAISGGWLIGCAEAVLPTPSQSNNLVTFETRPC